MRKFTLLHLSDLHIDNADDPNFAIAREYLKNDLIKIIKEKRKQIDAVVISGDIINKGKLQSYDLAKNMIREIIDIAELSADKVLIVPGNHDIARDNMVKVLYENLSEEDLNDINFINDKWQYFKLRFKPYLQFVNEVLNREFIQEDNPFEIRDIKLNDVKVRFILLNTSWLSFGSDDFGKLLIGRWQLENLTEKIRKLDKSDFCIAVTHHPLEWLTPDQKELVDNYLRDEMKLGVNAILHGHIHNGKIKMESNPNGTLVSLVSGIGYPEKDGRESGQPKLSKCRYSLYTFDLDNNKVDCCCRISNKDGRFMPDNDLYFSEAEDGNYTLLFNNKLGNTNKEMLKDNDSFNEFELDTVPVTAGWTGREVELDKLSNNRCSVAIISGVGGQGKSALAARYLREFARGQNKKYKFGIWVDCRELPETIHLKLVQLLEVISDGEETAIKYKDEKIEDTIKRFYNHLKANNILVVFDNIDAYVDIKNQEIVGDLSKVFNKSLDNEHDSFIIMTCRIPISDNRANYLPINLNGLLEDDGIKFFKSRDIRITSDEDIYYCKKIIRKTKGHPWWLGLIAGQIKVGKTSLKKCADEFSEYLIGENPKVNGYFNGIWEGMNSKVDQICKEMVRCLVEAPRPLDENDIILTISDKINFKDIKKSLDRLKSLGLLEYHEDANSDNMFYQVHPLVREFIHQKYTVSDQRPFVYKLLCLFLNAKVVNVLFNNFESFENENVEIKYSKGLLDSLETCLNSRNYVEALGLICNSYHLLVNGGFHVEFVSIGCRILKEIDWEKEEVTTNFRRATFLSNLLDVLSVIGNKNELNIFLQRYKNLAKSSTIPYSLYLSTSMFIYWRLENYDEAIHYMNEYDELSESYSGLWTFNDLSCTKGLILRDSGKYEEALEIFNTLKKDSSNCGNIGRCYQRKNEYDEALKYFNESLKLLYKEENLNSLTNRGYALFWIAEIMFENGKYIESYLLLYKSKQIWRKYAPALLSKLDDLDEKLLQYRNLEKVDEKSEQFLKSLLRE
ncbi:hypothetical protein CFOLD11_09000 [Clostridium folliculivorans]|uniref:Uncharacterized protein n=1 Tax=Clostridium folliculivorans TaxID=2886038 RepID=A0A9W6D9F5_9CLOT|nr:metallophosphoesterase [Clostridium folliculivorans]GKU24074.1 hypothetical protein CFOLD11_09000 [Clostridium folliculivorans]